MHILDIVRLFNNETDYEKRKIIAKNTKLYE